MKPQFALPKKWKGSVLTQIDSDQLSQYVLCDLDDVQQDCVFYIVTGIRELQCDTWYELRLSIIKRAAYVAQKLPDRLRFLLHDLSNCIQVAIQCGLGGRLLPLTVQRAFL